MYPLYNWAPGNPYWWITGFYPNRKNKVDCINGMDRPLMKENLIMIGSVDLSQFSEDAIDSLRNYVGREKTNKKIIDGNTVWIIGGYL